MVEAPILTLPEAEAAALRAAYQAAGVILEYGTGGSTVVASALPGRQVFAVESSAPWLAKMAEWFVDHPTVAKLVLHHGNIGKTKDWGFPVDNRLVARWSNYPLSIWDRADFRHPDVVLIDGRFRLACALTVLFRITKPVAVLIDDYIDRPQYKKIEMLVGSPIMAGRMALFDFTPMAMPPAQMHWILQAYANPN